ncbi:putative transposase, Ptta/En/Spm, plant [Helianthus debilis subsp. tardiflorus]
MCMSWNIKEWEKKSKAGRENHNNDLCHHTGGSMGFDEHRRNLEKIKCKKVGFAEVLLHTYATKECKKRLLDGEINANDYDKLEFVTDRSKRSYVSYMKQLEKVYGNTNCDDMEVWESLHPECQGRQLFGVGSSDPHFVLTGTPSSTASVSEAQQSHEVLLNMFKYSRISFVFSFICLALSLFSRLLNLFKYSRISFVLEVSMSY